MEKWVLVLFQVWMILVAHSSSKTSARMEGDALYSLRSNLLDPNNVLQNWDPTVGNPCTWFHVTCNSENSVTRVDLGNAELSGELVPELGQLKNLRYLELFSNSITGQIPSALGNLTNLVSLNLSSNGFTGPIPDSFGKLTKLRILELSSNNIIGQIPSALGNLTNLVSLDLSSNSFTGPIPDSFGKLTKLHILELSSNNITGQIPSALGNLTNLVSLDLSSNSFTGPIPDSFGKLTKLDTLRLTNNSLSGSIPMSLTNIAALQVLDLSNNRLSGLIPTNGSFSLLTPMSFANNILVWPVTWESSSRSPPPPYVPPASVSPPGQNSATGAIAGGVGAGSALLFAALAFGFLYLWSRKPQGCFFDEAVEEDLEVQLGQLKRFSLQELQFVTNNFSKKNILGRGGSGKVYKGCLADGTLVAVKRLKEEQTVSGESQFQTEVEMISMAVHRNLLPLRGFCMTSNERLLVYPYMANGSVASCLRERPPSKQPLDWPTRKRIAIGSAKGLSYLHDHCDLKIIHRDVKAANILLDEEFEAVVCDFGLARLMDYKDTHVITAVRGTIGHIAPEYLSTGKSSEKTDVFAYGIMLLELITGQRSFDLARFANDDDDVMLLDWVRGLLKEKKLDVLVDPELLDNYLDIEVERLVQLALLCTQDSPRKRPKMSEVVRMLEGDGLVEKWEEWQEGEVVRHEVERIHRETMFERDSFVIPKIFVL